MTRPSLAAFGGIALASSIVACSGGSSSSGSDSITQAPAHLRFVNAAGEVNSQTCGQAVSATLDAAAFGTVERSPVDPTLLQGLGQGTRVSTAGATPYIDVLAGSHKFAVLCPPTGSLGTVTTPALAAGASYTIVLGGTTYFGLSSNAPSTLQLFVFEDPVVPPGSVRVYHVAPDHAPLRTDFGIVAIATQTYSRIGTVQFSPGTPYGPAVTINPTPTPAVLPGQPATVLPLQLGGSAVFSAPALAKTAPGLGVYAGTATQPFATPIATASPNSIVSPASSATPSNAISVGNPGEAIVLPGALDAQNMTNVFPFGAEDVLSVFISDKPPLINQNSNVAYGFPIVVGVLQ